VRSDPPMAKFTARMAASQASSAGGLLKPFCFNRYFRSPDVIQAAGMRLEAASAAFGRLLDGSIW
jgi:hypothetical protein